MPPKSEKKQKKDVCSRLGTDIFVFYEGIIVIIGFNFKRNKHFSGLSEWNLLISFYKVLYFFLSYFFYINSDNIETGVSLMKRPAKISAVAGFIFFVLAALFSASLLFVLLDSAAGNLGSDSFLFLAGLMFTGVYGFCSVLIPIFLIIAGFQCFSQNWSVKNGVFLLGSVIPFFTLDAFEHACRLVAQENNGSLFTLKMVFAVVISLLVLAIEYLVLSLIGDKVANSKKQHNEYKTDEVRIEEPFKEEPPSYAQKQDESESGMQSEQTQEKNYSNTEITPDAEKQGSILDAEIDSTLFGDAEKDQSEKEADKKEENPFDHLFDDVPEVNSEVDAVVDSVVPLAEGEPFPSREEPHYNEEAPKFVPDEDVETVEPVIPVAEEVLPESAEEVQEETEDAGAENFEPPVTTEIHNDTAAQPQITDPTGGFDTDFFDIDMNAVSTDEQEAENEKKCAQVAADKAARAEQEPRIQDPLAASLMMTEESSDENPAVLVPVEDVFAQMDSDAAVNPVLTQEAETSTEPIDQIVDPLEPPVVDASGKKIVPAIGDPVELAEFFDDKAADVVAARVLNDVALPLSKEKKAVPVISAVPKKVRHGPYKIPTEGVLDTYKNGEYWVIDKHTEAAGAELKDTLNEFKIEAEVTGIRKGPVVTMFEILPAPGVKLSKIVALQDNIALRLAASSVRIVAPIPGKHAVGIEVPNRERSIVSFKEIIEMELPAFKKMAIPVILGKDISGEPQLLDLAKTPHLLIAGSTGSGKSVCVNSMILSILYKRSPEDVKLILIDPKIVELKLYNDIPHLLTPVITEPKRAMQALQYCICEMERRYAMLDGMGVRDIASYNKRIVERKVCQEKMPYIVVIIDEFADLMATTGKELESTVARLAAMSRAVGIHLVLATQRPSIDVITGLIKANIPSRIAFMVASKMDSRIIIDQVGAEKLLGKGDMLFSSATDPFPVRIQGTFVSDNEVENVVDCVKQYGEPEYIDDEIFIDDDEESSDDGPGLFSDGEDPLYDQALQIVVQAGKASASYIQRRLKIGYNRAARLVEEMESRGIVGPQNGSKPREIIHVP